MGKISYRSLKPGLLGVGLYLLAIAFAGQSMSVQAEAMSVQAEDVQFEKDRFQLTLPAGYLHQIEAGHRLFFMPIKGSAIAARVSLSQIVQDAARDNNAGEQELIEYAERKQLHVKRCDRSLQVHETEIVIADGETFLLDHYHIANGRNMLILTVGLLKKQMDAPEVKQLRKALPAILDSIRARENVPTKEDGLAPDHFAALPSIPLV